MALSSANVKVFPSAYRGEGYDPEAHLSSEKNLATITKSLSRYDGFVISWSSPNIEFVIGGYHFEVALTATELTGDNIYAHIRVGDRNASPTSAKDWKCTSLLTTTGGTGALDETDVFNGLVIDNTPTQSGFINLLLLYKDGTSYVVPYESKVKIKAEDVGCSYTVSGGNTVTTPISDIFVTQGAWIAGSGGFNVGPAVGTNKFSVQASSGNTTLRGDLRVKNANNNDSFVVEPSGNTSVGGTLAVTSTSTFTGTATFNGGATISSLTVNGNASVTGNISCANLEAGQQVKCDSLDVGQIGGTSDITLCKTLLPQTSSIVNLGSGSHLFNNIYSKGLYLLDASANAFTISYSSGWNISIDTTTNFLASGNLTIGKGSGGATVTFTNSDITFNKKIIASKGIEVNGTTSSDVLQSNVDVKIASGKCLDLSGSSTGSIKLRGETDTGSTSHAVVGNGIYNITFKSNLSSAPNSTYSVTMALIIPNPSSLLDSTIYSSEVYRSGQYGWQIKAVHNSSGWTLTFTSGGDPASCNWFVTKIADVA